MGPSPRGDLRRMAAILAVLLLVTGAVVLLTGGGGGSGAAERLASIDGRILRVNAQELVLQPATGTEVERFALRPIDARTLDLAHLQTHAAQGLPSRVHFERDGSERHVVRVDDLPPG